MRLRGFLTQRPIHLSAFAIAVVLTGGCGSKKSSSPGAEPDAGLLRVGILSTNGVPTGVDGWGYKQGVLLPALREAGVTRIQYAAFAHGPNLNEALASNAVDVGLYSDTPAIVGHAAGIKTRLVNQNAVGNNTWLIVRQDGPRSLEELRGKTVGTSKGTAWSRYLFGLLAEKGLTKDVKVVHLPSDAGPALLHGDIAAYAGSGPQLLAQGFRSIDDSSQHPELQGTSVTVVTEDYLAKHPQFPTVWNKAHLAAVSDVLAHPSAYYQFEADVTKQPLSVVKLSSSVSRFTRQPFTERGLQLLSGTKAFLIDQRLARQDFDVKAWIAPSEQASTASFNLTSSKIASRSTP
ncbi:MAG: aliphatic sulfonate transporter substrate-binding protein [Capsulimonas sp.]|jgi:sulfonate transport system substrate-binding protein|nr:aliphatic sulfonate transporter substrate-binding protein [Capsulimonas sp.]